MKDYLKSIAYLLGIHATGLGMLGVLRLVLYVAGRHFLHETSASTLVAFVRGLWFDNVIGCYLLLVPLVVITLAHVAGRWRQGALRLGRWWLVAGWALALLVSAADIPYFLYFFKHLNASIWNWAEYGATTLGMLLGEPSYYPPVLGFLALTALLVWATGRTMPRVDTSALRFRPQTLLVGLPLVGLCLFGIRGRMGYNPIKVSAAYYCGDAFLNQLGVNPAFNLLTSTLDTFRPENRRLHLMDDLEALAQVQRDLQRTPTAEQPLRFELPARADAPARGCNVVLLFMESMSSQLLGKGQTPFLDSLLTRGTYHTNCYSAGNHTNHGLYATLYSYPAIMFRNLMKGTDIPRYSGLPTVLREAGYRTFFFMTHESQYDNMNAFFRTNGYDEIHSQENYPREKVVNSFGVQDDYLYDYALERLRKANGPFLATLLSISNHPPYIIPPYFRPRSTKPEEQIVEYADWALRRFFEGASREPWYTNTLFVLVGDHGKLMDEAENEMPQSLNHVPLLFYRPGQTPRREEGWALQMDVQPTLLSLLGIGAVQNHFGVDLNTTTRTCAVYTADNVIGARSADHLYICNPRTGQEMRYRQGLLVETEDSLFLDLRRHLFSTLQAAEYVVGQGKTK